MRIGKTIERDPSIDRLIEIRTVLEKIRPIDYKLRYQIDKLVKTAITGVTNSKDPINFKVKYQVQFYISGQYERKNRNKHLKKASNWF